MDRPDPIRDCPHGRQKGKCPECDVRSMEVALSRAKRKVSRRDLKIVSMQKRITALESMLSSRVLNYERIPKDVEKAVQHALMNVRMIPVFALGKDERIVEVTTKKEQS